MQGATLNFYDGSVAAKQREIAMELTTFPRNKQKKSEISSVRRQGNIPAVIYSASVPARSVTVDGAAFAAAMRSIKKGHLPNTIFTLKEENGKSVRAVVKEIQYHRVSYNVLHLDFQELVEGELVSLNVPVEMTGSAECVGVKAGGGLRLIKRHVRVQCKPQHIPFELTIAVQDLQIKGSKRVRDVALPSGVEILAAPQEVIAVVGKR